MKYQDLFEFDTKLTADVVDWRPGCSEESSENILASGTYYLDKEKNQRLGRLYLLRVNFQENKLDVVNELEFENAGILDLKWIDANRLLTIDSNNHLKILSYDSSLSVLDTYEIENDQQDLSIGLTLDFNDSRVLTSDTKGFLSLFSVGESNIELVNRFKAHDYEVWSVFQDRDDLNLVYSGADDCTLKIWDLRDTTRAVGKCQVFQGGVCSILNTNSISGKYAGNSSTLFCGSYDERIHVIDRRALKSSVAESKKLNGGVWKIKPNRDILLCACMHTGVHIVDNELDSVLYYNKHGLDNLAYGCDWLHVGSSVIATCSFYNHNLRIWKLVD